MRLDFSISKFLVMIVLISFLSSCSSFMDNDQTEKYPATDEHKLSLTLDNIPADMNLNADVIEYCTAFYKQRNFKPIWIKDSVFKAGEIIDYVNSEINLNLPIKHLKIAPFQKHHTPYEKEIISILRLSEFLDIQSKGLIGFKDSLILDHNFVHQDSLNHFVKSYNSNKDWISHLLTFGVQDKRIKMYHSALNDFTSGYPLNDKVIPINIKKDTIGAEGNRIAKNLKEKGFLDDINISNDSLTMIFKSFQYMNGLNADGLVGKHSLKALEQTNLERYYKGIIALEKLKSIPDSLIQSKFIEVNIPTYLLRFQNADTLVSKHRIVVGANKTKTPEFSAPIQYIVTHPYWHVPYSIASTEILYGAKNDSNYIKKKNYTVFKKGKKVSPDSINWEKIQPFNFPFNIKQGIGKLNNLGLLKILFPNKHAIYIHDTPTKHLFSRDIRNFSHGCIRVQAPFKLAKHILKLENHPYSDSLDSLAIRDKETYLNINDTFYVHIRYRTVDVDDSTQRLRFFDDVYGREKKLLNLFAPQLP